MKNYRKILALLLATVLTLALFACTPGINPGDDTTGNSGTNSGADAGTNSGADAGTNSGGDTTGGSVNNGPVPDEAAMLSILDSLYTAVTGSEHADMYKQSQNDEFPAMLQGLESTESFKEFTRTGIEPDIAIYSTPSMNPDPFFIYIFYLKDTTKINSIKTELKDNANLAWQVCVGAQTVEVVNNGNYVMYIMCSKAEATILTEAFTALSIS